MTGSPRSNSYQNVELTGVTCTTATTIGDVPVTDKSVMPVNTNKSTEPAETEENIPAPVPTGHDTATTTNEEEATEALLALGNLPDYDDVDQDNDNATLMLLNIGSIRIYILTTGVVSNETNTYVRMYIGEFILVDIWIHCCTNRN